jgi:hypothetical protein
MMASYGVLATGRSEVRLGIRRSDLGNPTFPRRSGPSATRIDTAYCGYARYTQPIKAAASPVGLGG